MQGGARKNEKKNYSQKKILDAINNSGAIISTIAARLNCQWHTARKYALETPETRRALEDERERLKDAAETALVDAIHAGDVGCAKWYLSRKARDRGYGDVDEASADGAEAVSFILIDEKKAAQ